jgi:RNA polymerase sigma-70 factor (ECF subfamily)
MDSMADAAKEPAQAAIPRLFDSYGDRIFGLGLRICGSREDAQDLVQETFLRAYKGWGQFKGLSAPSTWLFTIAARTCKRLRRRRAGAPAQIESFHDLLPSDEEGFLDVPSLDESPLDNVLRKEASAAVEDALATMPLQFRMALVLKDLGEFSMAEVGGMLGIKETTVKTRVYRGRLHLAKQLKKSLPKKKIGPPDFTVHVCMVMFKAKMDALDQGRPFKLPEDHDCHRCRSMFDTLDISLNLCRDLTEGALPAPVRNVILREFQSE